MSLPVEFLKLQEFRSSSRVSLLSGSRSCVSIPANARHRASGVFIRGDFANGIARFAALRCHVAREVAS